MLSRTLDELDVDYGAAARALAEAGFFSSLLYEADGLRFSVTQQYARETTFLLTVRPRGAFVRTSKGRVYRVPANIHTDRLCVDLLQDLVNPAGTAETGDDLFARHLLKETTSWAQEEREERAARFQAYGWIGVSTEESPPLWARFETQLDPEQRPSPVPSVVWDISAAYDEDLLTDSEPDLTLKALNAMRAVTEKEELWYVFSDYNSLSALVPWRAVPKPYKTWWRTPILPRGAPPHMDVRTDHACFIRQDFRAGFLTYLREDSLCVFGRDLLDVLAADPPALFTKVRRRDGVLVLTAPPSSWPTPSFPKRPADRMYTVGRPTHLVRPSAASYP